MKNPGDHHDSVWKNTFETRLTRREFAANIVMAAGAVLGLASLVGRLAESVYPIVPPLKMEEFLAGKTSLIPKGSAKLLVLPNKMRVMIVDTERGFRGFSPVCTHLGCIVQWHDDKKQFICPCHKGTYDESGQIVSGPQPRQLDEFKVAVKGDDIFVVVPTREVES